jgi:hypothetical protein
MKKADVNSYPTIQLRLYLLIFIFVFLPFSWLYKGKVVMYKGKH